MNQKIKIIKGGERKNSELEHQEQPSLHPTREITTTIKLWVSEFKERRRTDEDRTRTSIKLILT